MQQQLKECFCYLKSYNYSFRVCLHFICRYDSCITNPLLIIKCILILQHLSFPVQLISQTDLPLTLKQVMSLSPVRLFVTPWTVAYQVPPSMGFSRQEYWSGLPFPSLTINLKMSIIYRYI